MTYMKNFIETKIYWIFSDYPKMSRFQDSMSKKVIDKMKDDVKGIPIDYLFRLKSSCICCKQWTTRKTKKLRVSVKMFLVI